MISVLSGSPGCLYVHYCMQQTLAIINKTAAYSEGKPLSIWLSLHCAAAQDKVAGEFASGKKQLSFPAMAATQQHR